MLNGWKGIAGYLNREERTAMRWAAERGLPVHRSPGRGRGSVYALREEIDAWLAADRERAAEARAVPAAVPSTVNEPSMAGWWMRRGRWREWLGTALIAGGVILLAIGALTLRGNATRQTTDEEPTFTDAAAKESYLQATYDWNLRTRDSLQRAVREYGEAISRDPRVASSYVGLANCYLLLRESGSMPDADAYPRAEAAARTALELAPDLAAAQRALAFVDFWWRHDRPAARRAFAQAIALRPDDPLTHHWFATALSANGERAAALREIDRARDLDPTSASVVADQGLLAYLAGRHAEGVALLRQIEGQQPQAVGPHRSLAAIAIWEGRSADYLDEAITTARLRGDGTAAAALGRLRPAVASPVAFDDALLRQARDAVDRTGGWFRLAQVASLAGRGRMASYALAHACAANEPGMIGARGDLWLSRTLDQARIASLCGEGQLD